MKTTLKQIYYSQPQALASGLHMEVTLIAGLLFLQKQWNKLPFDKCSKQPSCSNLQATVQISESHTNLPLF